MNPANCHMYTLYVTAADREVAVSGLVNALSGGCFCPFEVNILDIDEQKELLRRDNIAVTPALVREWPGPREFYGGDISAIDSVRDFLHHGC